jgi:hypothetical protein
MHKYFGEKRQQKEPLGRSVLVDWRKLILKNRTRLWIGLTS